MVSLLSLGLIGLKSPPTEVLGCGATAGCLATVAHPNEQGGEDPHKNVLHGIPQLLFMQWPVCNTVVAVGLV